MSAGRAAHPARPTGAAVDARQTVDVLMVRGDTTPGLRRGDDSLAAALRRAGCSVAQVSPDYRLRRLLVISRYTGVVPDLAECLDARRATTVALRRYAPRCIIYGAWFGGGLQPKSRLGPRSAVRFDSPPSLSRAGRGGVSLLRVLEARMFRTTGYLLPWGVTMPPTLQAALPRGANVVPLPVPIGGSGDDLGETPRTEGAVFYAGSNPYKKGLDIGLTAWSAAGLQSTTLAVAGIDREAGLRWCDHHKVAVSENVEWVGVVRADAFRRLLRSRSLYLAASRYEDHGLAQLEAMADGALLVTVPSAGPFEPVTIARQLPGELVADTIGAQALAAALTRAARLSEETRAEYRRRARLLTNEYSEETLDKRLQRILPSLLNGRPATAVVVAQGVEA
jgi:glycosyltransferase involved in cell wall biosynthesis